MSVFDNLMKSMRIDNDDFDDDSFYNDEKVEYEEDPEDYEGYNPPKKGIGGLFSDRSKVTPAPRRTTMSVSLVKPTEVEDAKEITEYLLDGRTVVLNMEGLRMDIAQRIIDFTCGATYAINGKLQKISNFIFIATPSMVELTGDFQDMIASGFSVSNNTFKM